MGGPIWIRRRLQNLRGVGLSGAPLALDGRGVVLLRLSHLYTFGMYICARPCAPKMLLEPAAFFAAVFKSWRECLSELSGARHTVYSRLLPLVVCVCMQKEAHTRD